jgi:hypothetical protein
MTDDDLAAALRACAAGLYPLEAGVALLAGNGTFLRRDDFSSRFITTGTSISDGTTLMAGIDRDAAIAALHAGELPCSGRSNGASSNCRPALPAASPSTCATPSPASTTATSPGWSPPSSTHPGNGRTTADTDDCFQFREDDCNGGAIFTPQIPRTRPPLPHD